jgi:hypothetical protein
VTNLHAPCRGGKLIAEGCKVRVMSRETRVFESGPVSGQVSGKRDGPARSHKGQGIATPDAHPAQSCVPPHAKQVPNP